MASIFEYNDATPTPSTSYEMSAGDTFFGLVDSELDDDWIKIELEAGRTYEFTMFDRDGNNDARSFISLFNESGEEVWYEDTATANSSKMVFEVTETGTYFISATHNDPYPGNVNYRITVEARLPEYSIDEIATYLTDDYWVDPAVSRARHHFDIRKNTVITVDIADLEPEGRELATAALKVWSKYSGLTFEFTDLDLDADIYFTDDEDGVETDYVLEPLSDTYIETAVVNISTEFIEDNGYTIDSFSFQTYLHEIGHALGLGDAGIYDEGANYDRYGGGHNHYINDSWQMSVMSWFPQDENTDTTADFGFVITPMMADIVAIQELYSTANPKFRNGDTTYDLNGKNTPISYTDTFRTGGDYVLTIFDTGGKDTFDFREAVRDQVINLNEESFSDINLAGANFSNPSASTIGNLAIARGTIIENAFGGLGADEIIGNAVANTLKGFGGNDVLSGGGRRDKIKGGMGDDLIWGDGGKDTLWGGKGADIFHFKAGDDRDRIKDFEAGVDQIDLWETSAADFDDLRIQTKKGNTKIWIDDLVNPEDSVVIILEGVRARELDADDFVFFSV